MPSVLGLNETDAPVDFTLWRGAGLGLVLSSEALLLDRGSTDLVGGGGGGRFGRITPLVCSCLKQFQLFLAVILARGSFCQHDSITVSHSGHGRDVPSM